MLFLTAAHESTIILKKKKLNWIKCFAYEIENIAEQAILSIQKTIT